MAIHFLKAYYVLSAFPFIISQVLTTIISPNI